MLDRIRASIPALPPAEQRVAKLLLVDPRAFASLPVVELAERSRLPVVLFGEGGGGRPGDSDGFGFTGLDCMAFALFGKLSVYKIRMKGFCGHKPEICFIPRL